MLLVLWRIVSGTTSDDSISIDVDMSGSFDFTNQTLKRDDFSVQQIYG